MNAKNSERSAHLAAALAALLALASAFCLDRASQARLAWQGLPSPLTRPLPEGLAPVTLLSAFGDHARLGADWRYIDALQYLGDDANISDGFFQRAQSIYADILWVDPAFRHAVREGATVLGWVLRRPRQAVDMLVRAMAYDSDPSAGSKKERDRYRVYLAALAYQKVKDDNRLLDILRAEVQRPDAPEMLMRIVGNVYLRNRDWEGALAYWTWVRGRAREWQTRHVAGRALARARRELAAGGGS